MNKEIILLIIIFIILAYYVDETIINSEITMVLSSIDGRRYIVQNLPDKQKAAELLAILNQNTLKLIRHLQTKYPNDPRTIRLVENYNPDALSEGTNDSRYTSFTTNKSAITMCLRDRTTNKLVDRNTLYYILNHENSHQLSKSIGHSKDEFWVNFKWLLNEAVEIDLYKIQDYNKNPIKYCGITITNNILIDESEKNT